MFKINKKYHLCTVSDYQYLTRGMALYESLISSGFDFNLYYLCIDEKSYFKLKSLNLKHIIVDYLNDIKSDDLTKRKNEIFDGDYTYKPYDDFCWVLASYYSNYLMQERQVSHIMYLDSDLFFYHSPQSIFDNIGDKSVGITPHRNMYLTNEQGFYNVGVIYFKNDETGRQVLKWWRDSVLFKSCIEFSTYGDQKYLDNFIPKFGSENIKEIDTAYIAPWNLRLYVFDIFLKTGEIIWGRDIEKVIYFHFSGFQYDINKDSYICSTKHPIITLNYKMYEDLTISKIYKNYYMNLKNAYKKHKL